MPNLREIVYGIFGAWRLALLDAGGMTYLDRTERGFWQSFFAAAIIAPAYLLVVILDSSARPTEAGLVRLVIVHVSAYSLSWTVYPVIIHPICAAIDRQSAFVGFIVALNWAKVIQMAAYLPVIVLGTTGLLPTGATALLTGGVYMLLLGYQWFVTRTALDTTGMAAAGLVILDLFLGLTIDAFAVGMLR